MKNMHTFIGRFGFVGPLRLIGALGAAALLLVGCATGGGAPMESAGQSRPPEKPAKVEKAEIGGRAEKAPKPVVENAPEIKPTLATTGPVARPKKPPVIAQPEAAPPPAVPPAQVVSRCKVRKNSVEWVYVSGGCRNGYAHGRGRARSVDGRRTYVGMFADGAFSGEGEYDWGNGVRYVGHFLNGRRNGSGTLTYPDSRKYSGQFKDNVYHGEGTYIDADGAKYVGQFKSGYFHGEGVYTWPNGDVYTGRFKANQMDGTGSLVRANGDRYVGTFENNEMNGTGTYTWSNGDAYAGGFRNDKMSGEGTYSYANGMKYAGAFKDGRKHGAGVLTTESGRIRQQWRDGEKIAEEPPMDAPGSAATGSR